MKNRKGHLLEEDLEVGGTRRGVEKKGAFDRSIAVVNKLQKATKLTTRTRIHIFIKIYGGREREEVLQVFIPDLFKSFGDLDIFERCC